MYQRQLQTIARRTASSIQIATCQQARVHANRCSLRATHPCHIATTHRLLSTSRIVTNSTPSPGVPKPVTAAPSSIPTPTPVSRPNDPFNNVTLGISSKIGRNLHLQPGHPLNIIKNRIKYFFDARAAQAAATAVPSPTATSKEVHEFKLFDNKSPIVTAEQNFDDLLVPKDHVGRRPSDTFYYNKNTLLRTHTSAHQREFLRSGESNFLVLGDCYRRDEIDASHYPVFHQMEGVKVFSHDLKKYNRNEDGVALVVADLKQTLEGLVRYLFGSDTEIRWIDAYFPFTHPSFEMEIFFQGKWLEVLGCGVIQYPILDACSPPLVAGQTNGWAFGLGLERLAMVLFDIPDIRLFWSEDARFLDQFTKVKEDLHASKGVFKRIKFQPFSKYPGCFKDVSFWVPQELPATSSTASSTPSTTTPAAASSTAPVFHENDFCSLVRELAGDIVESVQLVDSFTHPKTKQTSKCYRIMYRSLNRTLSNEEVDRLQEQVREQIGSRLGFKLR